VIGSVVYMGVARIAPGVIRWTSGNKFVIGEAARRTSDRTERVAAILRQSGFDVTIADDIHAEIWTKLIGNAAFNPLSAIARARIDELMNDPGLDRIARASMREVAAVAAAAGAPSGMDIEKRFAINVELGPFRTSMLQDYEAGGTLELGGLVVPSSRSARACVWQPR
jgi:2-dehydropantoate 2-reductase